MTYNKLTIRHFSPAFKSNVSLIVSSVLVLVLEREDLEPVREDISLTS